MSISIHALAKRATVPNAETALTTRISIHALAKRATLTDFKVGLKIDDFNPRPRKEGDSKFIQ